MSHTFAYKHVTPRTCTSVKSTSFTLVGTGDRLDQSRATIVVLLVTASSAEDVVFLWIFRWPELLMLLLLLLFFDLSMRHTVSLLLLLHHWMIHRDVCHCMNDQLSNRFRNRSMLISSSGWQNLSILILIFALDNCYVLPPSLLQLIIVSVATLETNTVAVKLQWPTSRSHR